MQVDQIAASPLWCRIALGVLAAICAALVPGEAQRLMSTPMLPRRGAASPLTAAPLRYAGKAG
jgi:hypothetical protein